MAKDQYGTADVREVRFSAKDLIVLALENLQYRDATPYNFDYMRPVIIWDGCDLIMRFLTVDMATNSEPRNVQWKSFEQLKKEEK